MLIPGRHEASGSYRYGFQGQEKDDEIKGEGNSLNYTFRMHDPRVGRFFAVDPLTAKYPWYTPYSFSGNKVIAFVELEGLEEAPTTKGTEEGQQSNTTYTRTSYRDGGAITSKQNWIYHTGGLNGSAPGWMTEESYNSMMNQLYGRISTPYADVPLDGSNSNEKNLSTFLNNPTRIFISGYREELLNLLDVSVANRENRISYLRSGHILTDDFNSPVFLFSGILKKLSLGKVAKATAITKSEPVVKEFVEVIYNEEKVSVYRGGNSMILKSSEYKINPETGLVKTSHGISLNVEKISLEKFGGAYKVESIPEGLQIIQRGTKDLGHFEITPAYEMTVEKFQGLLNQIKLSK